MDELAAAANVDPLEFRLLNLDDSRMEAVLRTAAEHFGWRKNRVRKPGVGVGIAGGFEKGSYVAACVEVEVDQGRGSVRVRRIVEAFECGAIQNPRIGVCTSLPTTPHLVVGRSACRVGVGPSLNRSWAQRSRPVVQAGRRAFPGDESVVD